MRLSDYTAAAVPRPSRQGGRLYADERRVEALADTLKDRVREALYKEVPAEHIASLVASGRERARRELAASVEQVIRAGDFPELSDLSMNALVNETLDFVLGLGPIEPLLADPEITEVMVNGPSSVFFEKGGVIYASKERFASEEQLRLVVDRIVSPLGRRIDKQQPIVNARLAQGHRVNVVIPPLARKGTALTIRKFREQAYTLEELTENGTLTPEMATLLDWAVRARKNIAVSGGTGGGKTTLLNALSRRIPHNERIITIEDSAELKFDSHPHVVSLEARMANAEGRGGVSIRELVVNALRMRPDRIVVGECRGAEAADMLQAMNTGHDGSLTTLHANSPAEVVPRLVMMVRFGLELPVEIIEAQVHSALDLIVQQDRMAHGARRITQIVCRATDARRLGTLGEEASGKETSGREASGRETSGKETSGRETSGKETPGKETPNDGLGRRGSKDGFIALVSWDTKRSDWVWEHVPTWIEELSYLDVASEEEVALWLACLPRCS